MSGIEYNLNKVDNYITTLHYYSTSILLFLFCFCLYISTLLVFLKLLAFYFYFLGKLLKLAYKRCTKIRSK